jgi:hypothetical protein
LEKSIVYDFMFVATPRMVFPIQPIKKVAHASKQAFFLVLFLLLFHTA